MIEIVPPRAPLRSHPSVPGSKSLTNRAFVLAALGHKKTTLEGALWSEDTEVMVEALRALGFTVEVEPDPHESSNRTVRVAGQRGRIPRGGTLERPLELFVGNAGTAARFLTALVCLGEGSYRLSGVSRMHERPQAALFAALRALGYAIDADADRLPAIVHGRGARNGRCRVDITDSSQFASALRLVAPVAGWEVEIVGENAEESPYVEMTDRLRRAFVDGGVMRIEPDASSGSYLWAAGWLLNGDATQLSVAHWPTSGLQVDERFPRLLPLPERLSRRHDLGDSIMTAIVLAPFADRPTLFTDLGRLRVQECERVLALRTELTRCGADVSEQGDTLEVRPSTLRGAEIETYEDHRVAMCFAVVGLRVAGMRIRNPACVRKTFPGFFQKLAQAPPSGLGVELRDAHARVLSAPELVL